MSVAQAKRNKKKGARTPSGQLSRAKPFVPSLPTPEQLARRVAQGLKPNDALDCQVSILVGAGKFTETHKQTAKTIAEKYRAHLSALYAPRLANGPLGGLQGGGGGGVGSDDAHIAASKAYRDLEAMLVHESAMIGQGGAVSRCIGLVCYNEPQHESALDGIRALLDRVVRGVGK